VRLDPREPALDRVHAALHGFEPVIDRPNRFFCNLQVCGQSCNRDIELIEAFTNLAETLINLVKALINLVEALTDLAETLINRVEAPGNLIAEYGKLGTECGLLFAHFAEQPERMILGFVSHKRSWLLHRAL
jgi:hypothetical protein